MKKPKFSIVTSVNVWTPERREALYRAVVSVGKQRFRDFEYVVINDGSTLEFEVPKVDWLKVITVPHNERVIGYNQGFDLSEGEWICCLDSDDEYVPEYLEKVDSWTKKYPEYEMFNFGCIYKHNDGKETKRDPFEPKKLDVGHEVFGGGNIVWGTFVFSRKIFDELGGFPPAVVENIDCTSINYGGVRNLYMNTPFDFSAYAQIEFPELRKYFMVDHVAEPNKIIKELGNPWGQDMYLFYKYTRKYHSKPMKEYMYVVYPKV